MIQKKTSFSLPPTPLPPDQNHMNTHRVVIITSDLVHVISRGASAKSKQRLDSPSSQAESSLSKSERRNLKNSQYIVVLSNAPLQSCNNLRGMFLLHPSVAVRLIRLASQPAFLPAAERPRSAHENPRYCCPGVFSQLCDQYCCMRRPAFWVS